MSTIAIILLVAGVAITWIQAGPQWHVALIFGLAGVAIGRTPLGDMAVTAMNGLGDGAASTAAAIFG